MSSASPHTGNAASAISPSKLSISVSAGSLPHPTSTSPSVSPTGSVSSVTFQLSTGNGSTPAIRMTRGQRLRDQAAQARSTASATPEPTLPPQPDGNMKKRINQRNKTSATLGTSHDMSTINYHVFGCILCGVVDGMWVHVICMFVTSYFCDICL